MLIIARLIRILSGWIFFITTLGSIPVALIYFAPGIYEWITDEDFIFKSEKSRKNHDKLERVVYVLLIILIGSFIMFCVSGLFNMILYAASLS